MKHEHKIGLGLSKSRKPYNDDLERRLWVFSGETTLSHRIRAEPRELNLLKPSSLFKEDGKMLKHETKAGFPIWPWYALSRPAIIHSSDRLPLR